MHQQEIIDEILSRLDLQGCKVHPISLVCSPDVLRERLVKDISVGIRTKDILGRSLERIPLYEKLNTAKVDVSNLTAEEAADYIIQQLSDSGLYWRYSSTINKNILKA